MIQRAAEFLSELAADLTPARSASASAARKIQEGAADFPRVMTAPCFFRSARKSTEKEPCNETESLGLTPSLSRRDFGLLMRSRHFSALGPRSKTYSASLVRTFNFPSPASTFLVEAKGIFRRRSPRKRISWASRAALQ